MNSAEVSKEERKAALDYILKAVKGQGRDILHRNHLMTRAYSLFQDIAQINSNFNTKMEKAGKVVSLTYEGLPVCKVIQSCSGMDSVSVSDGAKCEDFHGSYFTTNETNQMHRLIQDHLLRFCGREGICEI